MILSPVRLVYIRNKMSSSEDEADETHVVLLTDEDKDHDEQQPSTSDSNRKTPANSEPEPEHRRLDKPKQISAIAMERRLMQEKLMKQHNSQTAKVVCGLVTIIFLYGFAALMVYLAAFHHVRDLYIVAGIFIFGATCFTVGFIIARCTIDRNYSDTDYTSLFQTGVADDAKTNHI